MFKFSKRFLLILTIVMLLSTSVGQAASLKFRVKDYHHSRYKTNYYSPYSDYQFNRSFHSKFTQVYKPKQADKIEKEEVLTPEKPTRPEEKPTEPLENTPSNSVSNSVEEEVVQLVNNERKKAGLAPLNYNGKLSEVARLKSKDMADKNYFSHNSPTYGDPFTMMKDFGIQYKLAGENIAKGYLSPSSVVGGWMNSTGHRDNILNPAFKNIGIGYIKANGTTYWTQLFTD